MLSLSNDEPQPPLVSSRRHRRLLQDHTGKVGGRVHYPYHCLPLLQPLEGDIITSLEAARSAEDGIDDKYDTSLFFTINIFPPTFPV